MRPVAFATLSTRGLLCRALLGSVLALGSAPGSADPARAGPPGVSAPTESGSPAPLDQLMQLLAQRRHGRVSFTEVHQYAMLDHSLESSGELLYEAPDRLEKRTLEPKAEDLLLEHGVLTIQRGSRRRVLSLQDYPQIVPLVESIRATLAGDRAALERYFTVQFSGSLGDWTLELRPYDARVVRTVQSVRIHGERDVIRTAEIRQNDGDSSLLTLGPEVSK